MSQHEVERELCVRAGCLVRPSYVNICSITRHLNYDMMI